MFNDEVAIDRLGQTPRVLYASVAGLGGISLYFHDVPLAPGQIGGKVVELLAGRWPQNRLSAVKRDFHLGRLVVLIQAVYGRVQPVNMAGRALSRDIGILRLAAGVGSQLISRVSSGLGQADARLRPAIQVLNVAPVTALTSSSSLSLPLRGSTRLLTHFLRAKGLTRPQKPSLSLGAFEEGDREGVGEGCCSTVAGGVLCGLATVHPCDEDLSPGAPEGCPCCARVGIATADASKIRRSWLGNKVRGSMTVFIG